MGAIQLSHDKYNDGFHVKYDLFYPEEDSFTADLNLERNEGQCDDDFADKLKKLKLDYAATLDEIERLTNNADGYDYAIAVSAGIISGVIDAFFVGEWDFKSAKAISNREMNEKVMAFAKKHGLDQNANRLEDAIEYLEKKFPIPGDNTWHGMGVSSTMDHHLDDFTHHPTILGLFHCIKSQFTETATYVNRKSEIVNLPLLVTEEGLLEGKTPSARIASGFLNWCFGVAKNRKGHLFADMAGTSGSVGGGMGLPGTLVSLLKELSALPAFQDPEFSEKMHKVYVNGIGPGKSQLDLNAFNALFDGADSKFDLRTENAVKHELKRQSIPIAINEIIVRCCYFIRHLIMELKEKTELKNVDWKKVIPFRNRTIVRMLTISLGTFEVIDLGVAAIQATAKSGGASSALAANFVLRVNFVGIGRFTMAGVADISMGAKKKRLEFAVASADVALAAGEAVNITDEIEKLQEHTHEHLRSVTTEIDEVSCLVF